MGVSAVFAYLSNAPSQYHLVFRPFTGGTSSPVTMASADFWRFSQVFRPGLSTVWPMFPADLPGKNTVFPPSTRHIYSQQPSVARTFLCLASSSNCRQPSMWFLFVQAGGLPPTSFRFHLTVDTLVLSYGYCYLRRSGLSPYRQYPCRAHKNLRGFASPYT